MEEYPKFTRNEGRGAVIRTKTATAGRRVVRVTRRDTDRHPNHKAPLGRNHSGGASCIIKPVDGKAGMESFSVTVQLMFALCVNYRSAKQNVTDACSPCATCCFLHEEPRGREGQGEGN